MIRDKVQVALDTVLENKVRVYWQRKSGPDADEYIVYSQSGDSEEFYADNESLVNAGGVTVQYFYRAEMLDTHKGRQLIKERETTIQSALKEAGFRIPFGRFDAGDVDDIGYFVTVFECEYWWVA